MKLAILFTLIAGQVLGATYYVATTGSDSNPGSSGSPWLTVTHAATNVAAGDTVLVNAGIYNERPSFTVSGTTTNRITFKANGAVTNQGTWQIYADNLTIDGFEFTSRGVITEQGQAILIGTNYNNIWAINNQFHDAPGGTAAAIQSRGINAIGGVGYSSSALVSNNFFYNWGPSSSGFIVAQGGTNWLIVNNVASNSFGGDFVRLWGGNHIVRGNVVKLLGSGIGRIEGAGNSAFNGFYYFNNYLYTNWIMTNGIPLTNTAGYVLVNGLDEWSKHGVSNYYSIISADHSTTYAAAPAMKGPWTMFDSSIVSAPTNGVGWMDHPDFLQTWGTYQAGPWSTSIAVVTGAGNNDFNGLYYYSRYYYTNWGSHPGMFPATNAAGYIFVDATSGYASYGFTNRFDFVNSDRSITYAVSSNLYAAWSMLDSTIVSPPVNANGLYYPELHCTNIVIEGNWVEFNLLGTPSQIISASGTNQPPATHDIVFRNNVFTGGHGGSVDVYNFKLYNNTFYDCGQLDNTSGTPTWFLAFYDPRSFDPRGECYGIEITNNAFIACASSASQGWYGVGIGSGAGADYAPDLVSNFYKHCDYNYVCSDTNAWTAKNAGAFWGDSAFKFYEPHGINGGDPKIAGIPIDFRLKTGSPLINAGMTNLIATNDFDGVIRPLGPNADIGAFEYDSNLLMRLNFALGTATSVPDATGNGHNAVMMDSTNWITFSNGATPLMVSGFFTNNGIMTNQYTGGAVYDKSQYAAVTNIGGGLSNITSGTMSFWVRWITNYIGAQPTPERFATIMDAGDIVQFAADPTHTTNAWAWEYAHYPDLSLGGTPNALRFFHWTAGAPNGYIDTNGTLAFWTNQTRFQTNWWQVAVTWQAGGNLVAYENGVPFYTTAFTLPYLEVGGASPGWICVGALQHSGTPAWDFPDGQPNAGWFMGNMADVRIYNRVLSTNEVLALYSPSTPNGPGPPPATFSAGTIRAGRVSKP